MRYRYRSEGEMKDSGVQSIGVIPEKWELKRVKNISSIYGRIGFRGYTVQDLVDEGNGAITLSPSNIEENKLVLKSNTYISWQKYEESPEIKIFNGDIIFVKTASVGKVAYVENLLEKATINPQFIVFKNINCNKKYLFYTMISRVIQEQVRKAVNGGVVSTLTQEGINNYKIVLPIIEEQNKISKFLDEKTAQFDSIISKKEALIQKLEEAKKSIISEVVTGKVKVVKTYDGYELVKRKKEEMKDSGVEWVKRIPEEWKVINGKWLFEERKDKAMEGDEQLTASQKYGIITQQDFMKIENQKVVLVEKDFSILKHVEPNDFVISMRSFQGGLEYSTIRGCISSAYVMLIPCDKVYPPFFRWFFKSSKYINALQSTSNLIRDGQAMRFSNFVQIPIFIFSKEEQKKIADYLDYSINNINNLMLTTQNQIEKLKEAKQSLISEAVTGKIEILD
jgi:type I restriction enzyme, S subunit